jgi:hypothetical protein
MPCKQPAITPAVISEIAAGNGLSCAQAAKLCPSYRRKHADADPRPLEARDPAPCNPSTVFRWIMNGIRLNDGRRVHLEAAKLAGRYLTTPQALERFIAAQSHMTEQSGVGHMPGNRSRAAARADAALQGIGI